MTSNITPPGSEDLRNKLKGSSEVNITVAGRKTKKKFTTPVWFVLEGTNVVLVPMKGSDNDWFKDLVKNPWIGLGVGTTAIEFKATIVRNPTRVEEVLDQFRAKYRSMWSESYYKKRDVYVEVPV